MRRKLAEIVRQKGYRSEVSGCFRCFILVTFLVICHISI